MKNYHLTLAGLRTVLCTPHEITISENLQPFLCQRHEEADCTITLQSCAQLPAFSEGGVRYALEYYDRPEGNARIFHCTAPGSAAIAVTELLKSGDIRISVLPDYLSYFSGSTGIFNRIGLETLLLQHKGLLLHASLIKYEDKAIAFAGPSGVGKSTQADIWHHSLGAEIINGDRAALRRTADGWMAYGSPYAGTSGIYRDDRAPLAAIVLLRQATENRLLPLSPMEAFRLLYPELSIHHWDSAFVAGATDLCLQLLAETPIYQLECRPQESAALLLKKGLCL